MRPLQGIRVVTFEHAIAAPFCTRQLADLGARVIKNRHDVWNHEQRQASERWTRVDTAAGAIPALVPPGMTAADRPRMDSVPALGTHTVAILQELGFSPSDLQALRAAAAI